MRSIATIAVTFRQYVKAKNNEINILRRKVRALHSKVIKQEKQIGKEIKKKQVVPHYEPVPTPPLSSDSELDSVTFARAPISCDVLDRAYASHLATNFPLVALQDVLGDASLEVFFAEDVTGGPEISLNGIISPPVSSDVALASNANAATAPRATSLRSGDAAISDAGARASVSTDGASTSQSVVDADDVSLGE